MTLLGANLRVRGVRRWAATLETNKDGKHPLHLMLEFFKQKDRTAPYFAFEGRCPNARANDLHVASGGYHPA